MSSYEYNQLLQFLYFEGYADSYADAEELLESMSDEKFEEIIEAFKEPDLNKMKRQEYRHSKKSTSQRGGGRGDARNRAFNVASVRDALERGEDPRADTYGGAQKTPVDHRASFSKNPLNNPPRRVKEPGVKKEELEMQEAWYSGRGQYRTTVSGRSVRWDEDDATDDAVSAMMQKRREEAAKKAAAARLKAKGIEPIRKPKVQEDFESYAENLQNEGYDLSGWTWEGLHEYYLDEAKASPEVRQRAQNIADIRKKRQKLARLVVQSGVGPEHPAAKQAEKAGVRPDHLPKHLRKEEVEELDERKYAHSFPLTPSEKKIAARIRARLDGQEPVETPKSAKKVEPTPEPKKRTIKRTELKSIIKDDFDALVEHLFVKGYTDTIENAELMAENISENWATEILESIQNEDVF